MTLFVGFTAVGAHAFHLGMMKKLMKG